MSNPTTRTEHVEKGIGCTRARAHDTTMMRQQRDTPWSMGRRHKNWPSKRVMRGTGDARRAGRTRQPQAETQPRLKGSIDGQCVRAGRRKLELLRGVMWSQPRRRDRAATENHSQTRRRAKTENRTMHEGMTGRKKRWLGPTVAQNSWTHAGWHWRAAVSWTQTRCGPCRPPCSAAAMH